MNFKRFLSLIAVFIFLFMHTVIPGHASPASQLDERLISESIILIDGDTGQILYERDMHRVMRPASITKVMTALLALENADLDDEITVARSALLNIEPTAASIMLVSDEEVTLEQVLYAMAVVSAADASNVIAEHVSGTVNDFVKLMNERAVELGALNTNFVNTHGMPDDKHLTTAYDMALISMAAINTPGFNEIFSARRYVIPPTNKRATPRRLDNLNRMITGSFLYKDLIAGKTGWTISSQYTLFTAAKRDDRTLICISIRSPLIDDKYMDTTRLLEYGFNGFDEINFTVEELEDHTIVDANGREAAENLTIYRGFSHLIPKPLTRDDIDVRYITKRGDFDSELHVRVVFSLKDPDSWPGFSELGEVAGYAHVIEPVIERLPLPEYGGRGPAYAIEDAERADPVSGSSEHDSAVDTDAFSGTGTEPVFGTESNADTNTGKGGNANDSILSDKSFVSEVSPIWVSIFKDAGLFLVIFVIVLCFIISKKRRTKREKTRYK